MEIQEKGFKKWIAIVRQYVEKIEIYVGRNVSKFYLAIFIFSTCFYTVAFGSMFFYQKSITVISDNVATAKQISSTQSIEMSYRAYNQKDGLLAIEIQLKDVSSSQLLTPKLSFSLNTLDKMNRPKLSVVPISLTSYMVYISELKDWKGVRLNVKPEGQVAVDTVYFVTLRDKDLMIDDHLVVSDSKTLVSEQLTRKYKKTEEKLVLLDKQVSEYEKNISNYETEISQLKVELETKTSSERKISEDKITLLENNIVKQKELLNDIPIQREVIQKELSEIQKTIESLKN